MKIIRSSALVIPVVMAQQYIDEIKGHLTRSFKEYNSEKLDVIVNFYLRTKNFLVVPRYFPVEEYIHSDIEIEDRSLIGKKINIRHNIAFRDDLQRECFDWFMKNERGILHAGTGSGKTVVTIASVCEKGRKALILVYKSNLVDQWRKEFINKTNISEKNWKSRISILNSSSYEKDLQKDIIIGTNQTFISLIKRKRNEFIRAVKDAKIGILIGDEVHTSIGAPTFGLCSLYVPAKETFGLTATPKRYDGCHDIMGYHLGPLYTPVNEPKTMKPKIMIIFFDHKIAYGKTWRYIYWNDKFNRSRYLNMMYKSNMYMNLCSHLINRAYQKKRTMLFMHSRRKVLYNLAKDCNIPEDKIGMFIESASLDETKKPYVFTTFAKSRDGIDIPPCDLVVLGNPIGNVKQAVGRSVRLYEGKAQPVVVDIVDTGCEDMLKRYESRDFFYRNSRYEIEEYIYDGVKIRRK